jgi:RNA polymerase sigma factor (sigma-70 family)
MESFEEIWNEHARDVWRFARWLSGDPVLADDLCAEAFARAWAGASRIETRTVKAYLLAIVRNIYLKTRRTAGRQIDLDPEAVEGAPDPEQRAAARDEAERTAAALRRLPEGERAALLLRTIEELPFTEIGRCLGISEVTARVRVHRARLKLGESLRKGTAS